MMTSAIHYFDRQESYSHEFEGNCYSVLLRSIRRVRSALLGRNGSYPFSGQQNGYPIQLRERIHFQFKCEAVEPL